MKIQSIRVLLIAPLLWWASAALADDIGFVEAMKNAKRDESSLSPELTQMLTGLEVGIFNKAMSVCSLSDSKRLLSFALVVKLDIRGFVSSYWQNENPSFAKCLVGVINSYAAFIPPHADFYQYFNLTSEQYSILISDQ